MASHPQPRKYAHHSKNGKISQHPSPPELAGPAPTITCSGCLHGKTKRAPHRASYLQAAPGEIISSDFCGPFSPTSLLGNRYFISILDSATKYVFVACTKTRHAPTQFFTKVLEKMKNNFGRYPKRWITDNAKEFTARTMQQICQHRGISHELTVPHSPQSNAQAEKLNDTLVSSARAILSHAKLPTSFWDMAILDAATKYNYITHTTTDYPPIELWHKSSKLPKQLFMFGQPGVAYIPFNPASQAKLEPRGTPARYMHPIGHKQVCIYNMHTRQFQRIRTEDFHIYSADRDPCNALTSRSKYTRPPPKHIDQFTPPPATVAQARKYPDAELWAKAHDAELDKLDQMGAFTWQPLPPQHSAPIPMIMTYRYKRDNIGNINERKARCSVRGDLMKPHIHFEPNHTAAHLSDKMTIRVIFALIANRKLIAEHFDITMAFPHERYEHDQDIYVKQMQRFDKSFKHPHKTGKLELNVYGTPSGGYYYLKGCTKLLRKLGFKQSHDDPCLFVKFDGPNLFIIVCLNIDDFLVAANHWKLIHELFNALKQKYNIKRLGFPTKYLGWTITRAINGDIRITQPEYVSTVLDTLGLAGANPRSTPCNHGQDVGPPTPADTLMDDDHAEKYRKAVGELRWLADCTRPDIAFIVGKLAAAIATPTQRHWSILKQTARYLKGTDNLGLTYRTHANGPTSEINHGLLTSYSDADFAADPTDRKSTSGAIHTLFGSTIQWYSAKQGITALSTCEAEYVAATTAVQTTKLLRRILAFLNFLPDAPTPFMIDNAAAIAAACNTAPTKKRKFIQLRHHFLREAHEQRFIDICKTESNNMLADIYTKAMKRPAFIRIRNMLQMETERPETAALTSEKHSNQGD